MADQPASVPGLPDPALQMGVFEPMRSELRIQTLTRPSLSYWQDAWQRLKANKRAILSLYIIVAMLLFTVLGPLVWRVDPAEQDLLQVSSAPGAERSAIIVAPYSAWDALEAPQITDTQDYQDTARADATAPASAPVNITGLQLAETATTQQVRLEWHPMAGAAGYAIYRNLVEPSGPGTFGLPLGTTGSEEAGRYEDLLDLRPGRLFYSVVAMDAAGHELPQSATLRVNVANAITLDEAADRQLIEPGETYELGSKVNFALHPMGTDYLGRDMLARLMQGARVSLFIGIAAPLLFVLFGIVYGSVAGFIGGRADQLMMRFADFVVALPFLLFMILFKIAFGIGPGESGIIPLIVAMVILLWPATARLVRGQILQVREEAYVNAARLLGAKTGYLVLRHMIPNTMGVILVTLTFAIPSAIFTEAFLSFIGMGVAAPTASWGSMSNDGIKSMLTHPHELFFPALMISITVLAFNLLGDGLRDALDAKMRSRE
jgi:oligopeptide transport system permease protein